MGYSYGRSSSGRMALSCDECGRVGGVSKRKCPFLVTYVEGYSLPYCGPPALCGPCMNKLGGVKGVHGDRCREGAAASNAKEAARKARLAAGEFEVKAAFGDWHATVPSGMVGVIFRGGLSGEATVHHLLPDEDYDPTTKRYLSDYSVSQPWRGPSQGALNKRSAPLV